MSNKKGILTKEREKFLADFLDEKVKAKGLLEQFDGLIFRGVILLIDDYAIEQLNDPIKEKLSTLVDMLVEGKYDEAALLVGELLDIVIDIPNIDDSTEAMIFKQAILFILNLVHTFITDKDNE